MAEPLGTKTGDLRSGPPPVGSTVSLIAVRVLTGTEGYNRKAGKVRDVTRGESGWLDLTLVENVLQVEHISQS